LFNIKRLNNKFYEHHYRLFFHFPSWVEDKINTATEPELERWAGNILDANTPEEVFL
jgi:hypothetical protein